MVKAMTNGDKIRSMSDSELARFLFLAVRKTECDFCAYRDGHVCDKRTSCVKHMAEYLSHAEEVRLKHDGERISDAVQGKY